MADQNDNDDGKESHDGDVAKKGVKDTGHLVTGALGEPIPGAIADVADGDR